MTGQLKELPSEAGQLFLLVLGLPWFVSFNLLFNPHNAGKLLHQSSHRDVFLFFLFFVLHCLDWTLLVYMENCVIFF